MSKPSIIETSRSILKRFFIFLICLPIAQGCIAKRKIDRTVNKYYANRNFSLQTQNSNLIILNMDRIQPINNYSQSHYKSYYTLPLVFYYHTKELIKCDVNPKILVNYILNEINTTAEDESNNNLFNGKEIELVFEKVPTSFYYYFKHQLFVPFLAPIPYLFHSSQSTELLNRGDSLHLSYTIRNNLTHLPIKQGKVSYQMHIKTKERENASKTEFIMDFYQFYDDDLLTSGKEIAKQIINELN